MNIVICGNYGVTNIGDEAIREGLGIFLNKLVPQAKVEVMGLGLHFPFGIRSFLLSFIRPILWKRPKNLVQSCDFFILGGGGLFTDEEGVFVSTFWILHGLVAAWLKKPVLILGVSVGPMNFLNRSLFKMLLKRSKIVSVRDKNSMSRIVQLGGTCHLAPDFAHYISHTENANIVHRKDYVVLSIRPFKNYGDELYKKIAQLCDYVIKNYRLRIVGLPLQKMLVNDSTALNKIFDLIEEKSMFELREFTSDLQNIFDVLQDARCVLSMRLHAGILSSLVSTPFMPLSYMEKVVSYWSESVSPLNVYTAGFSELAESFDKVMSGGENLFLNAKSAPYQEEALLRAILQI